MNIITGGEIQGSDWQHFIRRQKCFAHDLRWRGVIERSYGLRPYYMAVRDGPELVGALPLFLLPGLGRPGQLISLPYLNHAGLTARSPAIAAKLEHAALRAAGQMKANCLVLRSRSPKPGEPEGTAKSYCSMIKTLSGDEQALWEGLRDKERNQTRKSQRSGMEIKRDHALLPVFFKLYQLAMHVLGTPPHSIRWFRAILQAFGQDAEVLVAYRRGLPLAAMLLIMWDDACHVMYAASLSEHRKYCPSNGIYWEAMRLALEKGKSRFNFGRSIYGGGTYSFKKHYGAQAYPLRYERLGADGSRYLFPPLGTGAASWLWCKMPLSISNALGPRMQRYLLPGFGARSL